MTRFIFAKAYFFIFFSLALLLLIFNSAFGQNRRCHSGEQARHWLTSYIPEQRSQLKWHSPLKCLTWAVFGNDDDGLFGERASPKFHPEKKASFTKALKWFLRNPFHNFCFYVIGSAQRQNSECTLIRIACHEPTELFKYRPAPIYGFTGRHTTFYCALHGGKPFIALRLVYTNKIKSEFYFGWRERGNFGIKVRPFVKRKTD